MTKAFPWWSEEQKTFAKEIKQFVDELVPRAEEAWWKREFPWDIMDRIAKKGYFGVGIPKQYGGMGLGVTGIIIASEQIYRLPGQMAGFGSSMISGVHQIALFGTEQQKARFFPRIAQGQTGAVAITEPFVGTDAAAIETFARRDGDKYIITGKKRFVTGTGVASRYMLYAKTSDDPEARRRYRHLSAFIVEKGMPGFTVERINELIGLDNGPNGYLNLDEVPVPVENRIGEEGEGWRVMTSGLNQERLVAAAQSISWLHEAIKAVVPYTERRIQFGRPTIDIPTNQFKLADLIMKLRLARLAVYYAAYLLDLGEEAAIESSMAKLYAAQAAMQGSIEAVQIMGGDGVTKFYPIERILREAKIGQIAAGTDEATQIVIYRTGLREMADELKMPHRIIHKELGVPIPVLSEGEKLQFSEDELLRVLAEDYRVNPGLYMSREDLKERFAVADKELDEVLESLEGKAWVKLHRGRKGIELAKASYEGLRKAKPPEYYRWFPSWVREENIF